MFFQVLARIRKYLQQLGRKIDNIVQQHEASCNQYKQSSKFSILVMLASFRQEGNSEEYYLALC